MAVELPKKWTDTLSCKRRKVCVQCISDPEYRNRLVSLYKEFPETCPHGVTIEEAKLIHKNRRNDFPSIQTQVKSAASAMARVAGAVLTGMPVLVEKTELDRRGSICLSCEKYKKGRCILCGCSLKAKRRLATERCPIDKWVQRVSLVIPARGEKEELQLTIDSARAAGVDEIIVVDDGGNRDYTREDIRIINEPSGCGPAFSRNAGLNAATGDIIAFSDSHVRFPENSMHEWASWLTGNGCLGVAAMRPMGGRDWTAYGGRLVKIDAGYNAQAVLKSQPSCTALYGSVYGATREVWGRVGGWPLTLAWGYNEQALSLAALFAGVDMIPYERMVVEHKFKKRFGYSTSKIKSYANRVLAHWYFFDDFGDVWKPKFQKHLSRGLEVAEEAMQRNEIVKEREKFQSLKRRTDDEVYRIIDNDTLETFSVSRSLDAPDKVKVSLFTPHAPGRESLLEGYRDAVDSAGHPIHKMFMMADTDRPDVKLVFPGAVHLNASPLSERTAPLMSGHMAMLWNTAINAGLADDVEWVWSLEDDVVPEPGTLRQMVYAIKKHDNIGIVTTGLRSHRGHLMVYRLKSVEPFKLDRKRVYRKQSGVREVGSAHVGCTLIKADILRNFRFTATPNCGKAYGHEWSLMKMCHRLGLKVVCDWDIAVEHVKTAE